jgi:hypothetical protein
MLGLFPISLEKSYGSNLKSSSILVTVYFVLRVNVRLNAS